MCYSVSVYTLPQIDLQHRIPGFHKKPVKAIPKYYKVSGFANPELYIITPNGLETSHWGLIPSWTNSQGFADEIRNKTLNAVGETVFEKPSFKKSIISQRCLVPVNGFFESRSFNKVKYPYFIQVKDHETFCLGGIYDLWINKDTGEQLSTFSILTTPANSFLEKIHNLKKRMPLILFPEEEKLWIEEDLPVSDIKSLINPYPPEMMKAYTITRESNKVTRNNNYLEILDEVVYPELVNQ